MAAGAWPGVGDAGCSCAAYSYRPAGLFHGRGERHGASAGRVEQSCDGYAVRPVVVDLYRLACLGHVRCDGPPGQVIERARIDLEPPVHAQRQDYGRGAVGQEFFGVGGLDAGVSAWSRYRSSPIPGHRPDTAKSFPAPIPSTCMRPQETARILGDLIPSLMINLRTDLGPKPIVRLLAGQGPWHRPGRERPWDFSHAHPGRGGRVEVCR